MFVPSGMHNGASAEKKRDPALPPNGLGMLSCTWASMEGKSPPSPTGSHYMRVPRRSASRLPYQLLLSSCQPVLTGFPLPDGESVCGPPPVHHKTMEHLLGTSPGASNILKAKERLLDCPPPLIYRPTFTSLQPLSRITTL